MSRRLCTGDFALVVLLKGFRCLRSCCGRSSAPWRIQAGRSCSRPFVRSRKLSWTRRLRNCSGKDGTGPDEPGRVRRCRTAPECGRRQRLSVRLVDVLEAVHAPHLVDIEIAQVLRRYALRGVVDERLGAMALGRWMDFDVGRHPHQPFLGRIWRLRAYVTAYDASYLALAEALSTALVTCDRRLAGMPGTAVAIELI